MNGKDETKNEVCNGITKRQEFVMYELKKQRAMVTNCTQNKNVKRKDVVVVGTKWHSKPNAM